MARKHMLLIAGLMAATSPGLASDRTLAAGYDQSTHLLKLQIEDNKESANACDYHIERFEYISDLRTAIVQIAEETCLLDIYGKKKAVHYWYPPRSLRTGSNICVIVNGKKMGTIQVGPSQTKVVHSGKCE